MFTSSSLLIHKMRHWQIHCGIERWVRGTLTPEREACKTMVALRPTVHRAMFRNGLGWVDFVWGDEGGDVKANGKRPGERGISHILESRQRKDGMTEGRAIRLLDGLVETIAKGEELRRAEIGGATRSAIAFKNMEAVLVKNPGSNTWLLTGWELKPGVTNAANDATGTTHRMADSSDHTEGAGDASIAQNQDDGNPDIRFSRTAISTAASAQGRAGPAQEEGGRSTGQ